MVHVAAVKINHSRTQENSNGLGRTQTWQTNNRFHLIRLGKANYKRLAIEWESPELRFDTDMTTCAQNSIVWHVFYFFLLWLILPLVKITTMVIRGTSFDSYITELNLVGFPILTFDTPEDIFFGYPNFSSSLKFHHPKSVEH